MTNLHRSPLTNQSRTDLEIANESRLMRLNITDRYSERKEELEKTGRINTKVI